MRNEASNQGSGSAEAFGTLRVALIAQFPALLDSLGCKSGPVLRRAGIPRAILANTENRVGYQAVGRLLVESVRVTGLAHFGVLAGERFVPAVALGEVIELMRNSPTVEAALRALVLHHYLNDSGAAPMLLPQSERRIVLAHSIYWPEVPGLDTFYDAAISYGMQIMRLLCGTTWQPARVTLARSAPADLAPYRRMFGERIRFDANVSAIEFAPTVLQRSIHGADPTRYALLRNRLQERLLSDKGSLTAQVSKTLRPMILAGTASAAAVASLFSISDRVLRSRLASEHTTVRQLIQELKLAMALQLMRTTHLGVSEISAAVGYADPPSFVRAFKRQYGGVTPGRWRASRPGAEGPE